MEEQEFYWKKHHLSFHKMLIVYQTNMNLQKQKRKSSLGIDRDNDCFFVLKTEKWSVDGVVRFRKVI